MADRIFKGRLILTGDVSDENRLAFPEASDDFRKPHKGGLDPFQTLYGILKSVEETIDLSEENTDPLVQVIHGSLWISGDDAWVKIDPDGTIEIGTAGA